MDQLENIYDDIKRDNFLLFIAIFVSVFVGSVIVKLVVLLLADLLNKKTEKKILKSFTLELKALPLFFFVFLGVYIALLVSSLDDTIHSLYRIIQFFLICYLLFYIVRLVNSTIKRIVLTTSKSLKDRSFVSAYLYFSLILRMLVWVIAVIVVFSNLGYDLTALVAGLGLTGFAIANAFKNTIMDILASFMILSDKVIQVGDYIDIEKQTGTVMQIGIRSTKLKTDDGNLLVVPNAMIANKAIKNYKEKKTENFFYDLILKTSSEKDLVSSLVNKELEAAYKGKLKSINIDLKEVSDAEMKYEIKLSVNLVLVELTKQEFNEQVINLIVLALKKKKLELVKLAVKIQ